MAKRSKEENRERARGRGFAKTKAKRGNRPVDQLMPGTPGAEKPPGFLSGRHPDAKQASMEETLRREAPKIPETLPDGTEIQLSLRDRKVLAMVLAGATVSEIAREINMTIPAVRNLLAGRQTPHVRETFRLLLEATGVDAVSLVAKAHELLNAKRAQWNPATESWDLFPDNAVQLGTWRPLIQMLGFMPARAQAAQAPGPQVQIVTNIFGAGEEPRDERTLGVSVPIDVEAQEIEEES